MHALLHTGADDKKSTVRLSWLPEQVEAELRELDPVEAAEYLESLGAREGGLASLIRAAYSLLGLRTYFTTGGWHVRVPSCVVLQLGSSYPPFLPACILYHASRLPGHPHW